ncbi:hypothetical protein [Turicibacter bilis]|uniref:hypothetical protein n=1 Tax=Turicibacter bilis TaxID=2735723 RepID=UPI0031BB0902
MKSVKGNESKVIATTLAVLMSISMLPVMAHAVSENTPKEEVVYINLNNDGSVEEINVVNIFELNENSEIVDYGKYKSIRNMTTTDEIKNLDDTIIIDAQAGKLYYEGKLDSRVIPWDISIQYYMDDKEYTADEIAGQSGSLKIKISVSKNELGQSDFFDTYALQASLTLDTKNCANIVANEATIANVGSDKQLTYILLPGQEADITITADVTDFEMGGISINGIPLNLNIEVDDEKLIERVTELLDAIEQLDDGANELKSGVADLQEGVKNDLQAGVNDLQNGVQNLYAGTKSLKDGGSSLQSGVANLQIGAEALNEGLQSLNDGIVQIQTALQSLNGQSSTLTEGSSKIKSALSQIQGALNSVSVTTDDFKALIQASSELKSGIESLVSNVSFLYQNVSYESYKSVMLQNGLDIEALKQSNDSAINALQATIVSLSEQIATLQAAGVDTTQLQSQVAQLDNIISLFGANNASISGTESYLSTIHENLLALLEAVTALQTNYTIFDAKIDELVNMLGGLAYKLTELSTAINTLVTEYEKLDSGINAYTEGVSEILAGYSQVSDGATKLVTGSGTLKNGTETLYSGTSDLLSGIVEVYNGTGTLTDGTGTLDEGVAKLLTGIVDLYDGTGELKDGTTTMREETSGMDTEISDKIDELLESITGGDRDIVSFVSEKNTNVNAVQFVIQSQAIEVSEVEENYSQPVEELNFWGKLLKLFGIE